MNKPTVNYKDLSEEDQFKVRKSVGLEASLSETIREILDDYTALNEDGAGQQWWSFAVEPALLQIMEAVEKPSKVDRFEVIDDTGRAYVKGSIYGSPIKVELSFQDDGRTLKVFVKARLGGV